MEFTKSSTPENLYEALRKRLRRQLSDSRWDELEHIVLYENPKDDTASIYTPDEAKSYLEGIVFNRLFSNPIYLYWSDTVGVVEDHRRDKEMVTRPVTYGCGRRGHTYDIKSVDNGMNLILFPRTPDAAAEYLDKNNKLPSKV